MKTSFFKLLSFVLLVAIFYRLPSTSISCLE